MRGEDLKPPRIGTARRETPPLARGRPEIIPKRFVLNRNTPACAGKTGEYGEQFSRPQKHPRLRGEDQSYVAMHGSKVETPPLARGRPKTDRGICAAGRNTPACAGKTFAAAAIRFKPEKHPRLRGEDVFAIASSSPPTETPPLARGRPRDGE